jgi:ribonucleoside-diphosphate reductase alpha chain
MGRKLTSLEVHDLCCMIADVIVVGGVRRSAMISLSNLSDDRMRHAKSGQWWNDYGYRGLANCW